ncbi:MAG TPA: hypothetical protein VL123_07440 [Candidatus Udaeobacter sp.]|jgi:hypothetical protein|nr:hypothetical protein [Candidatus Udaeobacter sp.]
MKRIEVAALLTIGAVAGCMAGAPLPHAQTAESHPPSSTGTTAAFRPAENVILLDRSDFAMGTSVEFHHLPEANELQDAAEQFALRHVVIALNAWPQGNLDLPRFGMLPEQADAIVILPGYPPDRTSLDAWRALGGRVRLVLQVDGPPEDRSILDDLNTLRNLERVVARMEHPTRAGFERLQRPLSFVKLVE